MSYTWLKETRSRNPRPPILFIDHWKDSFLSTVFELGRKEIETFHALGIHINDWDHATDMGNGWLSPRTARLRFGRVVSKLSLMPRMTSVRF